MSKNFIEFFQLNSLACINLQLSSPSIALPFLDRALQKAKAVEDDCAREWTSENRRSEFVCVQSKVSMVVHNLAIAQFKLGNFQAAWRLFEKVAAGGNTNYLFWYRYAVCGFNHFIQACEQRTRRVETGLYSGKKRYR